MNDLIEETVMTEEEYLKKEVNPFNKTVQPDSELKTLIVNYVGTKINPESEDITLDMVIEVFANEFPDFLLPIAEENFMRGYQQAMFDVEQSEKLFSEHINADGELDVGKLEEHLQALELAGVQEDD